MYFKKENLLSELKNLLEDLEQDELAYNTLRKYRTNLLFFIDFVDKKSIEKNTVRAFKREIIEKYNSTATVNSYISSANKFLKYLNLKDLCVRQEKVQSKTSSKDFINYTDYHRLLRYAKKKKSQKMYFILRVLGEVGIRVEELKFFKVESLQTIIIVKNKGKTRNVIVKKDLLVALRKYAREEHIYSGYLFPGKSSDVPIHPSTVRRNLKRLAGRARVKKDKVHPHSFRHYFAKRYSITNSEDLLPLKELLGHSDINTTILYIQLSDSEKSQKLKAVKF